MSEDNPGVRFPPPFLFVVFFFAGVVTKPLLPVSIPGGWIAGVILAVVSALIAGWGVFEMLRRGTNILPDKPATSLVRSGPFRFSRNPLYVSMTLGYLSAALWSETVTALLLLPLALLALQFLVIRREERYLEARFGDEYRKYCAEIRRWI